MYVYLSISTVHNRHRFQVKNRMRKGRKLSKKIKKIEAEVLGNVAAPVLNQEVRFENGIFVVVAANHPAVAPTASAGNSVTEMDGQVPPSPSPISPLEDIQQRLQEFSAFSFAPPPITTGDADSGTTAATEEPPTPTLAHPSTVVEMGIPSPVPDLKASAATAATPTSSETTFCGRKTSSSTVVTSVAIRNGFSLTSSDLLTQHHCSDVSSAA